MVRKSSDANKKEFEPFRNRISNVASSLNKDKRVWESKISLNLYLKIRTLIEEIPNLKFALSEMSEMKDETAQLIRYGVGEWWKREYHDKCEMNIKGLNTNIYKRVVEICNIEHDKVNADDPRSRTMWLDTLCAEGGIPVFDIINKLEKDKSNLLIETLEELYAAEGDIDDDLADKLFGNNQTIRRSTSIRELIPRLQKGNMPYDCAEKINHVTEWTFAEFMNALKKAKEEQQRSKFSLVYHLWKMEGFPPVLKTCIKSRLTADSTRNYAITTSELQCWGVGNTDGISDLKIEFSCSDAFVTIPYFKCGKGDWIPFETSNIIETDLSILEDIEFNVMNGNDLICTRKIRNLKNKGYVQMYSQDGANYTSFGGSSRFSLVIFNPEKWSSSEAMSLGNTGFDYIFLTDGRGVLQSKDKSGCEAIFNNAEGSLFAEPEKILFTSDEFFGRIGDKFECEISDTGDVIPVFVTDSRTFVAKLGKTDKRGNEFWKDVAGSELQIQVKTTLDDRTEWKNLSCVEPDLLLGLKHLRIKAKGKETKFDCFFMPGGASITRRVTQNSVTGSIEINGMAGFDIRTDVGLKPNDNGNIISSYQNTKESNGCWLDISDSNGNILHIGVFWPYDYSDILKENSRGHVIYCQNAVATVFAGAYIHRRFSSDGVSLNQISEDGRVELNDFVKRALLGDATECSVDGCTFKLFNKELKKDDRYSLIIECGQSLSIDSQQMKFIFVPSNKGEVVPLSLKIDEIDSHNKKKKWLHIVLPDYIKEIPGVIFQSLEGNVHPEIYFRPLYKPGKSDKPRIRPSDKSQKQKARIESYFSNQTTIENDFETALRAFNIAGKIRCHYGWFDELKALCAFNDGLEKRIVTFFEMYVSQCKEKNSSVDYAGLWRLVGEFMFDWLLIPAQYWKEFADKDKNSQSYIENLFRSRPGANGAVRYKLATLSFAILKSGDMKFTRTSNKASTIAKFIRGKGKDTFRMFSKNPKHKKEIIDILRALNDEDLLEDIIAQIKTN